MRRLFIFALLAMGLPALGQVFDCSSGFNSTLASACGASVDLFSAASFMVVGTANGVVPARSGSSIVIAPAGGTHYALSFMYQTPVNIQAFTTVYSFISNNQNIAFTINNCPPGSGTFGCGGFSLNKFSAGASCEGGFYQAYTSNFPTNVFTLMFDQYGLLHAGDGSFTYSSAQIYQQHQSPCNPGDSGPTLPYWSTTKLSTSPVAMDSPSNSQGTTTGHTYSATLNYDGSNLNLCMIDVTLANGTCNSTGTSGTGTFYQHTWTNVSIPSQVNGTTGYIGIVGSSGSASIGNLTVTSWTYTINSATASPTSTVTAGGSPTATNPSFSPVAGGYSGTQNVTITAAGSSNICYTLSSPGLTIMPIANQLGGCAVGTLYTGAVAVSSTKTLYAVAGLNGTGTSSGVVQGVYTIGSTTASTPTFLPTAGTYTGTQTVAISTTSSGAIICYNTTGSPATNGSTGCITGTLYTGAVSVPASETLYAVAGGTGYVDSSIGSAAYTINSTGPTIRGATLTGGVIR